MIRKTIVMNMAAVMLFALISVNAAVSAMDVDFSGTWLLDMSKSEGLRPGVNQMMIVRHNGDSVEFVTKVMAEDNPDEEMKDAYSLDGKETEFTPPGPGGATGKRISKWSENGRGIDVVEKVTVQSPNGPEEINIIRHWELSADGKTLILDTTFKGPMGERITKRVFVKK